MTDEPPSAWSGPIAGADAPCVIRTASIEDAAVAHVAARQAAHRGPLPQALLEVRCRRTLNGIVRARDVRAG